MELPTLDYAATVPAALRRAATTFSDRDFLVSSSCRVTFAEFDSESRRLAKRLIRLGVGKGTRVGVHYPSGPEWALIWAACARIGALFMPLSTLFRPREFRAALRQGDIQYLLSPETLLGKEQCSFLEAAVPELAPLKDDSVFVATVPYLRRILVSGEIARPWATTLKTEDAWLDTAAASELLEQIELEVHSGDELMVIFTSGSTADPKAVVHTHGSLVRKTAMVGLPGTPEPGSRTFAGMPFFWVGGMLMLGAALQNGATLITQEKFDARSALDLMDQEEVSNIIAWKSSIDRMRADASFGSRDLQTIPAFVTADAIDPTLRHNSLGMTETLGPHSGGPRSDCPEDERRTPLPERLRGSWGALLEPLQHRIVDPETGCDLPEGSDGEICVRGFSLLARMYKRERHEVFDDSGWFHTGDRGYVRDGYLFFTGRLSEMIKTRGANVSPREVEAVLESYPEIELAIVFGVPDATQGERVVAGLVVSDVSVDIEEIERRLRADVSPFKVPAAMVPVDIDQLQLLVTGKPDRLEIQKIVLNRVSSSGPSLVRGSESGS